MTIFSIRHITAYSYNRPVGFGQHRLMFRPRDSYDQRLLEATLICAPEPHDIRWIHDVFGNCVAIVDVDQRSPELRFETWIKINHTPQVALDLQIDEAASKYPFAYDPEEEPDLACVIHRHYPDTNDEVGKWARRFVAAGKPTATGHLLMTMCYAIHESFVYGRRYETGTQTPQTTLKLRKGTCRDFALLMVEAARSLGMAARFVTGYVYVPDRDGSTTRGGGSTHAWCQIYIPGAGWVEFDPTNGIVGNRDLIRVGVARDPRQAVPLWGSYDGKPEDFVSMTVQVNVTTEKTDTVPDLPLPPMEPSQAISVHR